MTNTQIRKNQEVTVTHRSGTELGTVTYVSPDGLQVTVRFADRTETTVPASWVRGN